jgi:hypothetical protein
MSLVRTISLLLLPFLWAWQASAQSVSARAEVSPEIVMEGASAEYTIAIENTRRLPNFMTPRVDGLEFSDRMGTSTFQQIINGQATVETRATWSFQPRRTGRFTIPGRSTRINGEEVEIPPVTFEVVPMSADRRSRAFLQLEIPEGPFFVGQAVPARLGLFVRDDLSLANIAFPDREGDAFLNTEFDDNPQRSRVRIEGRIYEAFVWDFILTPIRSGEESLRYTQQIALQIPDRNNPFSGFFQRTRSEPVTLSTQSASLTLQPLPTDSRPEGFFDAIGLFDIRADLSSRDLQVGEPLTLTLTVEGEGNFARMAPPALPEWPDWRLYAPKESFEPADERGFAGRKAFEYILIPRSPEITEIPELRLATFNPQTGAYVSTIIEPEPVSVRPSDRPAGEPAFSLADNAENAASSRIPETLLPIHPEMGRLRPESPPWTHPGFVAGNLLAAALFLGLGTWRHQRQRLRNDARLARRQSGNRKIRLALREAGEAARKGDSAAFYRAARFSIQERLCHFDPVTREARSLVSADCREIMLRRQLPETVINETMSLLDAADAHGFAGQRPSPDALEAQNQALVTIHNELNRIQVK